jgi:hypothetical protein
MSSFPTGMAVNIGRLAKDNFKPDTLLDLGELTRMFAETAPDSFTLSDMYPQEFLDDIISLDGDSASFDAMTQKRPEDMSMLEYSRFLEQERKAKGETKRNFFEGGALDQARDAAKVLRNAAGRTIRSIKEENEALEKEYKAAPAGRKIDEGGVMEFLRMGTARLLQPAVDYFYDPMSSEEEMERLARVRAQQELKIPQVAEAEQKRLRAVHRANTAKPYREIAVGRRGTETVMGMDQQEPDPLVAVVEDAFGIDLKSRETADGWDVEELRNIVTDLLDSDFAWFTESDRISVDDRLYGASPEQLLDSESRARLEKDNLVAFMKSEMAEDAIDEVVQAIVDFNYSQPGFDGPMENWKDALKQVLPRIMVRRYGEAIAGDREKEKLDQEYLTYLEKFLGGWLVPNATLPENDFVGPPNPYANEMIKQVDAEQERREVIEEMGPPINLMNLDQSDLGAVEYFDNLANTFDALVNVEIDQLDARSYYQDDYLATLGIGEVVNASLALLSGLKQRKDGSYEDVDDGIMEGLRRLEEVGLIKNSRDVAAAVSELEEIRNELYSENGVLNVMQENLVAFDSPDLMFQALVTQHMQEYVAEDIKTFKDVQNVVNTALADPDKFTRTQRIKIFSTYNEAVEGFSDVYKSQREQNAMDGRLLEILKSDEGAITTRQQQRSSGSSLWAFYNPNQSMLNAPPEQVRPVLQAVYDNHASRVIQVFNSMGGERQLSVEDVSRFMYIDGNRISLDLDQASPAERSAFTQVMFNLHLNQPTDEIPSVIQDLQRRLDTGMRFLDDADLTENTPEAASKRIEALNALHTFDSLLRTHRGNTADLRKFFKLTEDEYVGMRIISRFMEMGNNSYFSNPGVIYAIAEGNPTEAIEAIKAFRDNIGGFALAMGAVFEGDTGYSGEQRSALFNPSQNGNIMQIPMQGTIDSEYKDMLEENIRAAGIIIPEDEETQRKILVDLLTMNGERRNGMIAETAEETQSIIDNNPRQGLLNLLRISAGDPRGLQDMAVFTGALRMNKGRVGIQELLAMTEAVQKLSNPITVNKETGEIIYHGTNVSEKLRIETENRVGNYATRQEAMGAIYLSQRGDVALGLAKDTLLQEHTWITGLQDTLAIPKQQWVSRVNAAMKAVGSEVVNNPNLTINTADYTLSVLRLLFEEQFKAGVINEETEYNGLGLTVLQDVAEDMRAGTLYDYRADLSIQNPSSRDARATSTNAGSREATLSLEFRLSTQQYGNPKTNIPFILDYRARTAIETEAERQQRINDQLFDLGDIS